MNGLNDPVKGAAEGVAAHLHESNSTESNFYGLRGIGSIPSHDSPAAASTSNCSSGESAQSRPNTSGLVRTNSSLAEPESSSGSGTSDEVPPNGALAYVSSTNNSTSDTAPSTHDVSDGVYCSHSGALGEANPTAPGANTGGSASRQSVVPLLLSSNSSELVGLCRQTNRNVGFEEVNHSKIDMSASDSQRPMSSRSESRRADRASTLLFDTKQCSSRGVQTSAPGAPPVATSCTRHPTLRCFTHLASYDRCVVPEDSFTEKCGRGKLIGTRPPRPGSTSSAKYDRLPPHIRSLMNFRQETIHPAVLRVGLQMGQRKIVGANARTAAMLTAFQRFIEDYSPPPYQAIDKHLKQMLDRQINFITHCRPHSIAMGGTIRWLKRRLSSYASLQLEEARSRLCLDISNFITGRLLSASWMAASIVEQQLIENKDVVMVFGRSTAVSCALLQSRRQGLQFSVVMVDAPHSVSGQATAKKFADAGIYVTYTMLNGISYHIRGITKVLLGCAALLANGYVVNSAGAATVAMMGKMHAKPVLVVTETYKMSDRVMLDSCSFNELADPTLVWRPSAEELGAAPAGAAKGSAVAGCTASSGEAWKSEAGGDVAAGAAAAGEKQRPRCGFCQSEFEVPVANPVYDVTPAQFIDYVVTEEGVFPASSIPALICGLGKSPALAD